jgi:hypothetical protein
MAQTMTPRTDEAVRRCHGLADMQDPAKFSFVLADDARELELEVNRLRDIIRRAEVKFFEDGSDRTAAANMLTVLHEAKLKGEKQ